MKILASSSNKDLPRIMPVSTSTSCKFRVSLCQETKQPKTPEKTKRKKMKEEKGKRGFMRPRLVFPVKKITSVVSGVFSRKKPLKDENRGHRDDSKEETLAVVKTKPNFWGSARTRLKILILRQRLKTRRKRRRQGSINKGSGEEELCKKRILMGERCKPINRSGVLQYDGDGIIVPEP